MTSQLISFFLNHSELTYTLVAAVLGIFWSLYKFSEYLRDKRFDRYHSLIKELVDEQIEPDKVKKLHRQIAVVFELRNFPSYFPVSKRILQDLKNSWTHPSIVVELDRSIDYMSSNFFVRFFMRLFKK